MVVFLTFTLVLISSHYLNIVATEHQDEKPLLLTPYIESGQLELARSKSKVNPEKFLGVRSHTGFVTVKKEYNNNLFFWYFPAAIGDLGKTPLVIWLSGGPGVSSLYGLFRMTGPWYVENGKLKMRKLTWVDNYSVLYIDNPVGAGFSFTDDERGYPDNEDDVGDQLLKCLDQVLQLFPELRSAPLFVAGQSYAGKYVPALAIQIHRQIKDGKRFNLKGIMIGNGLIDPVNMMHHTGLCRQLGLLDGEQLQQLSNLETRTLKYLSEGRMVDAANGFNQSIEYIKKHSGVNIYDLTRDPDSSAPEYEGFLQRAEVRHLIHVGNVSFDLDNQHVYEKMLPDIMNTTRPFVEELLEHYGVMSYSGQNDVILPYTASKHVYEALRWSGREKYQRAKRTPVRDDRGNVIAYVKVAGNFVEALVRHAGHTVSDAPESYKWLIDTFISKFASTRQLQSKTKHKLALVHTKDNKRDCVLAKD